MVKLVLIVAGIFTVLFPLGDFAGRNSGEPDIKEIRKQLIIAVEKSRTTDSLYQSLNLIKNRSPLIDGYIGTLQALKAKHAWNPYYKIKYLNDSEKTLKRAVADDPHNIEIRFMRFSIEHNVPGFLGYNKNLLSDREEMIRQLDTKQSIVTDRDLTKVIIKFLLDSKRCTTDQNQELHKQLAALK